MSPARSSLDAIVVGAGPNGLAAAIELARAGRTVRVYEANATVGGGSRSGEVTLPGFVHDICSTAHPLAIASPFVRSLDLARHGLEWAHADVPLAHALEPGRAVILDRSVEATAAGLGDDSRRWRLLFGPLVADHQRLLPEILGPVLRLPRHPLLLARFALRALPPADLVARRGLRTEAAGALFAGMAAHSMVPLGRPLTSSFALVLGLLAHAVGWPFARGGSGRIAAALEAEARGLGVEFVTGHRVAAIAELPPARAVLFDVTPRQLLAIAGDRLPSGYARALRRFRYGPGVFKIDWALDGAIPWTDQAAGRAGTVHVGGSGHEVARAEAEVAAGRHPQRPFVIVAQPTVADPSRAPVGKHIGWAYCHVPSGSPVDMTEAIERHVERFAPGFRDLVLARHTMAASEMEAYDANYVGGDINGGLADIRQLVFRPVPRLDPYAIPGSTLYLCSSSTPPGGGVHGMSGVLAARSALRRI